MDIDQPPPLQTVLHAAIVVVIEDTVIIVIRLTPHLVAVVEVLEAMEADQAAHGK